MYLEKWNHKFLLLLFFYSIIKKLKILCAMLGYFISYIVRIVLSFRATKYVLDLVYSGTQTVTGHLFRYVKPVPKLFR